MIVTIVAAFWRSQTTGRSRGAGNPLRVLSEVPSFELTNQFGQVVTSDNLLGKVWVADIIFTRCPGPCVFMTKRMKELQEALPPDLPVQLVSLTTDPEFDSPDVMRAYAERFKIDQNRWWFLTGSKQQIGNVAVQGLKLVLVDKAPAERESPDDLFIHSTLMVVVDKKGRLRATFQTWPSAVPAEDEEQNVGRPKPDPTEQFLETRNAIIETVKALNQE